MQTRTRVHAVLAASMCAALSTFCSPTSADDTTVANGTWGGDHIRLEVTSAGATVEFDCAHGMIDEPLMLDAGRRFDVSGSFTRETGGPIREDQRPPALPARYRGSLTDSTLTLTIMLVDSNDTIGPFTLRHDVQARLTKCL